MRVLGVDPGLTRCGIAVIDASGARKVSLVSVGVARSSTEDSVQRRLAVIADAVEAALDEYKPDALALERVFAQHNVRTVMGTAQASGVVMIAAQRRGIPVSLYTPTEVKAAVTGSGRAAKPQVATMVARILGLAEPPKPADAADAVAIAIAHAWRGGVAPAESGAVTAAQRAWAEAERAARRRQ
jgi:crossover junction endodeoxyribonuclease RuvC